MKRISSTLVLTLALSLAASTLVLAEDAKPAAGARPGGHREGGPGRMMDPDARAKRMQTDLGLNDDQTAKIKAIYEKSQAANGDAMKKLREDTSISQEDKRKKMGEMMASTHEEVNAVLTPDQQTKWKEEEEKRRADFEKRRAEGGGRPGAAGAKPDAAKTDGAK